MRYCEKSRAWCHGVVELRPADVEPDDDETKNSDGCWTCAQADVEIDNDALSTGMDGVLGPRPAEGEEVDEDGKQRELGGEEGVYIPPLNGVSP